MCGRDNVEIWLTCKGTGAGSNTTMDWFLGVGVID